MGKINMYFSIFEDDFPSLYKDLMKVFQPDMTNFSDKEGNPYFFIDFEKSELHFERDSVSLPENLRYQKFTNVNIEIKIGYPSYISISHNDNYIYKRLEISEL